MLENGICWELGDENNVLINKGCQTFSYTEILIIEENLPSKHTPIEDSINNTVISLTGNDSIHTDLRVRKRVPNLRIVAVTRQESVG